MHDGLLRLPSPETVDALLRIFKFFIDLIFLIIFYLVLGLRAKTVYVRGC